MKNTAANRSSFICNSEGSQLETTGVAGYTAGGKTTHLDNEISALSSVQPIREMRTTNGCKVTMVFRAESNPQVRKDVAGMLLSAFERRSMNHEASALSVQSFH